MLAVAELAAAPRQWPSPLPEPPSVPFEYLHRIASRIDAPSILAEAQGQIIDELRRKLSEENDDLARRDILQLFRQLRERHDITVTHAAEIDEILQGAEAKTIHPPSDGATRLPPAHHWRQEKATTDPVRKAAAPAQPRTSPAPAESRTSPAPAAESSTAGSQQQRPARDAGSAASGTAEPPSPPRVPTPQPPVWQAGPSGPPSPPSSGLSGQAQPGRSGQLPPSSPRPAEPTPPSQPSVNIPPPVASSSQGRAPSWLADMVGGGAGQGTGASPSGGAAGTGSSTRRADSGSHSQDTRQWWSEAEELPKRFPGGQPDSPPSPLRPASSDGRFAFIGAVLGSMSIPLSLLSIGDSSFVTVVTTLLLLGSVLGLSMAVVAATRHEPWARVAVVLGALGLISSIIALVGI